jgi:hypothetical protein
MIVAKSRIIFLSKFMNGVEGHNAGICWGHLNRPLRNIVAQKRATMPAQDFFGLLHLLLPSGDFCFLNRFPEYGYSDGYGCSAQHRFSRKAAKQRLKTFGARLIRGTGQGETTGCSDV